MLFAVLRAMVSPLPTMVMALSMGGRPLGPYQLLFTAVNLYVAPGCSTRI